MASASSMGRRNPGKRDSSSGFHWVTQTPSPVEVEMLEASFPEVIKIPVADLEAETAGWLQLAVIVRSFLRWVPADAIIREFRRAGVAGAIVPLSLAFRCHVFRFESEDDRNLVLQRPWVVNGQVVGTEEWRPEFKPAEDSISTALLWVRLPELPLEFWKEEFIRAILEPAGEVVCLDAATMAKSRGGLRGPAFGLTFVAPSGQGLGSKGASNPSGRASSLKIWREFVCTAPLCI